jgi:hypothetical protein
MNKFIVQAVHDVNERCDGQFVDLETTVDGRRTVISLTYATVAIAVKALLVGHLAAGLARHGTGLLSKDEHGADFALRQLCVEQVADHVGLALMFEGGGILPVQMERATACQLGEELIAAAERDPVPDRTLH